MRIDARRALVGWVVLVVAAAAAVRVVSPYESIRIAFLLVPAGFLLGLFVTSLRHYFGDPASPTSS